MPKERVYDEAGMWNVTVGWEREKYAQVGIETHDGNPIFGKLTGAGEDAAQFTSLWGTFDRAGLNRLIRSLRKARDEAFGKDA